MNKLRKFLVIGVMAVTALSTLMVAAPTNASASAGDLIKMAGNSSVYYLGSDGKRYVFPNTDVYMSWYNDFSGVVTIPSSEMYSYQLGGNVVMRAGTKLVKITTDPAVYAVEPNGVLRKIQSEAQAAALYGTNWNKRVVDVADSYFTNYTIGTVLANGATPAGSLVQKTGDSSIYYYDGTNYRSIASEAAFNANRFKFANVLSTTATLTAGGTAIANAELVNVAQKGGSTGVVVTGSGLMVSLSANTAASNSIVGGQALADLASFNFTAANDGAVTVKGLKLKRIGISGDDSLGDIYLYDGVTRLTDGASFSNGMVSFSSGTGLITVAAGQTKTITVKANVVKTTGNIGVAINAASDITSTGAATTGGFPLNGNLMSMTSADGISAVAFTDTLSGSTVKAGNMNTIVWSESASVTNKAVDFKYIAFKQVGSMNIDDLSNLSLYVDGTKVATSNLDSNNSVAFNLATPVRLNTGNHTIELKADVIKGSSRTFSFRLETAANAVFTDTNYNINVAATGGLDINDFTIGVGTLSVSADSTFSDTQVVKTATNVTLSKFKIKAYGEDVKVNSFPVSIVMVGSSSATTTEKINDLAVVVNGSQVGSSKSVAISQTAGTKTYSDQVFGTTNLFTIPAGTEVIVEIKGSLALDSNTAMTSIKANIGAANISGQGATSYTTVTGSAQAANNTLSIVTGSMTVAKNTNTQDMNVSKNTSKVKIGSYILSAGSAEGVNISNIRVSATTTVGNLDSITNLYISENTTPVNPQAENDFNTNLTIDKSQSKTIDVYADLGDIANGKTITTSLTATYKTTVTQTFGTSAKTAGQTMLLATASLAAPTNVTDSPASNFVLGGTTATAAKLKFVATNGTATINELYFDINPEVATHTPISQITVDGVTAPVVSGKVTMTGLNTVIAAGLQGVQVEVKAAYNNVTSAGQGGVDTGKTVYLTLTGMKYTVNGTQMSDQISGLGVTTNSMKLVSAYPTVVDASAYGTNNNLVPSGKSEVMRFTVANTGNNPVNLKSVSFIPYFDYFTRATSSIKIYDANDLVNNLATSTAVFTTTGTAANVALTNDVTVNGTRTFVVYADNTGTASTTGNYFRMDMVNTGWSWNDSTIAGSINGTYVKEFTGTTFKK